MDLTHPNQFICSSGSFTHENSTFQGIFTLTNPHPLCQTQNTATFTEEVVWLLTEQIQRRTSWDHQKLLFSGENQSEQFIQQNVNNIYEVQPLQNNLQFTEEKQKQKYQYLNQLKTPDLMPESFMNGLDIFFLQKKKDVQSKVKKQSHCSCKKSKCLKMYGECFRNGETCQGCECCGCDNTQLSKQQRKKAKLKIEKKQPTAFIDIFKYKGCRCTKSNCEKGYCQCFANGLMCGKYCKCTDCNNCTKYRKLKLQKCSQKSKVKRKL